MYKEPVYIWSSGLGRILELMKKSSVGIISAFRDYRTKEENLALTEELKQEIRKSGFGFVPVQGQWITKEDNVEVEMSFAISRPGLTCKELIANLVEIGRANPEFNQEAYFVASEGRSYLIAGEDNEFPAGKVIEEYDGVSLSVAVLEEWLTMEQTNRTTLAKGPDGRGFTWSCAQYDDWFAGLPVFAKQYIYAGIKKAPERVFGIKTVRNTGGYYGRQLIQWGVRKDIDGFPIMENDIYVDCPPNVESNGLAQWKRRNQKGNDFAGEIDGTS